MWFFFPKRHPMFHFYVITLTPAYLINLYTQNSTQVHASATSLYFSRLNTRESFWQMTCLGCCQATNKRVLTRLKLFRTGLIRFELCSDEAKTVYGQLGIAGDGCYGGSGPGRHRAALPFLSPPKQQQQRTILLVQYLGL